MVKRLWFAFAFLFPAYSCVKDGYAPEQARPVADSDVTVWDVGIPDFSEGIYKLDFEGNIIEHTLEATNDFEGITVDRANGNIYLVEETDAEKTKNSNTIYRFNPDTKALDIIYQVEIPNSIAIKGLKELL